MPAPRLLLLRLLLWQAIALRSAASGPLPLELAESVLRDRKVINLEDVIDRQLAYSLRTVRQERFIIQSSGELPPVLFATVTPCLSPVEVEFNKFTGQTRGHPEVTSAGADTRPVQSRLLEEDEFYELPGTDRRAGSNFHSGKLVGPRSATYKLETVGTRSLSLLLSAFHHSEAPLSSSLTHVKALLKLSTRYPNVELGTSRYDMQICNPGGGDTADSPDLLRVRVSHGMVPGGRLKSLMRVCVVVNTVRRLNEYCAAQIGLNNSLPYPRPGLLDGARLYVLPRGSYAYNCTARYSNLWNEEPIVNVSQLMRRDPDKLFVNAYLIWPGSDGQVESVAWESSLYYRKDPQNGRLQPMVACNHQYTMESSTDLVAVPGTSDGVYEAAVSVQMPPNTSLLVRPSRMDMVASAYSVVVTPYSGQSKSFSHFAGKFSCYDSVWGYGGVVCGRDTLHTCLQGDGESCRHDNMRLTIRLEHKIRKFDRVTNEPMRHRFTRDAKWVQKPHQVQWQFVHLANNNRQDVVQPRIGRVEEAIMLLRQLLDSVIISDKIGFRSAAFEEPKNSKSEVRKRRAVIGMCETAFKQTVVSESSQHLIRNTVKCYKKLLQVNILVVNQCESYEMGSRGTQPFRIQIASPVTSLHSAVYSPSVNSYLCRVFELSLTMETQSRIKKLSRTYRDLMKFSKPFREILQQLEIRLLSTVSTFELPDNDNQGFNVTHKDPAQLRPIRHRSGGRRQEEAKIRSMQLIYQNLSKQGSSNPEFDPAVTQSPSLNLLDPDGYRLFAIYIYAMPSGRMYRTKAGLSLFAFKLHSYSRRLHDSAGCRDQELRQRWRRRKDGKRSGRKDSKKRRRRPSKDRSHRQRRRDRRLE